MSRLLFKQSALEQTTGNRMDKTRSMNRVFQHLRSIEEIRYNI